uniref:Amino acid transporter transmembrane domain-containing protein n=1 Tax=Chenopodium quinoa TaxID=63459 RepID=A0A803KV68_CHEQI
MENTKSEDLSGWLPITANRKGNWWFAAIHNVIDGWCWYSRFTLWFEMIEMIEMHEIVPGKRFDRYHELGQYAFGEKLGLWVIVPQQLMVQVGCDIVFMLTGGSSLMKFYNIVYPSGQPVKLPYFIMMYASVQFFLSNLPDFNSIAGVSFAAAIMSLIYSAIAWIASLIKGVQPDISYGNRYNTDAGQIFGFLSGLGTVAFAFSGHNIVLEIQATMPSTTEKPSKIDMWKGSFIAYIVVALCDFPVAIFGYLVFGSHVEDNVMISFEKPGWLIAAANLFVVIHVIGSYQVFAMPVFDMLESFLVLKMKCKPSSALRVVTRTTYVDSLYNMANNMQTKEIQFIMVSQL